MVHAGHRAPVIVESFQIILVHGIFDVRIVEVGEEDAQRVLVGRQTDFPGMVQCLGEQILVFGFVDRDAVDGHIGDGCLGAVRILLVFLVGREEQQTIAGSEGDAAIFDIYSAVFCKVVARNVFCHLI